MATRCFRDGKWYDKDTGEEVEMVARFDYSAPMKPIIIRDYEGYNCPVTGSWIEGRAAHRENLKRTGCRLLEKGEREHNAKIRERNLEESTARTARQIAEKMAERI